MSAELAAKAFCPAAPIPSCLGYDWYIYFDPTNNQLHLQNLNNFVPVEFTGKGLCVASLGLEYFKSNEICLSPGAQPDQIPVLSNKVDSTQRPITSVGIPDLPIPTHSRHLALPQRPRLDGANLTVAKTDIVVHSVCKANQLATPKLAVNDQLPPPPLLLPFPHFSICYYVNIT